MTSTRRATPSRGAATLGGYQPGLDSVRGISMLAIFGYHAQIAGFRGAFLSVTMFFTLSGFLIATVVFDGHRGTGTVDLVGFWTRRVRRLLPGALFGIALVMLFGAVAATQQQAEELPGQVAAALLYVINWHFIITDQSYVALFAEPSPLQHFWTLAIEEQFYIVLPVVLLVALRSLRRRGLGLLFAGGAVASTGWMIYLYESGAGLDRLYYGTDTRVGEILVGVVLAVIVQHTGAGFTASVRRVLAVAGPVALAATLALWTTVSLTDPIVYRGLFLATAGLTAVIIMALISGAGPMDRLLSFEPLPWLGRLSYGIYVVHWPVLLWLTEERTGLGRWPRITLAFAVTLAISTASYYFIERPIRRGARLGLSTKMRIALGPVVAVALLAGTAATANTDGEDPFETLRSDGTAVPIATADGVLDILAFDGVGDGVVDRLVTAVDDQPAVRMEVGPAPICDGLVEVDGNRTCAAWAEAWPELAAGGDPDVVLFYTDGWSGTALAELDPSVAPDLLAAELLGTGFDLLTSAGAPIVWAVPSADLATELARSASPIAIAVDDLENRRDDVFRIIGGQLPNAADVDPDAFLEQSAATLLSNAALYQRSDRSALPRVLVVGDSQSRSLGYGLERWGAENRTAWVWNAAVEGCGFLPDGRVPGFGGEQAVSELCRSVRSRWAEQLATFEPDVVIAFSSVFDVTERRLDDWPEARSIGDEAFDQYVLEEYREVVDELTATGAPLVWMLAPCAELRSTQPGGGVRAYPTEDIRHLNEALIGAVAAEHPGTVETFDLFAVLCPDGEPIRTLDGVGDLRPDGLHFSVAGSLWFAETYGDELISRRSDG